MSTGTRWMLSVLVVVVVYAVLMTAAIGSYEFLILLALAVAGLVYIWLARRGARR